ncbi:MAG: ParB/RepB/Spo0J family partition protein [Bacilli bacterium]|nr:ParB/RepB/Spo0J family partition protein [Bacilli bacterium]
MNNETKDEVVYLYLDDIIPNRFQPREVFDEKALKELAVSIREHGVIQPIIVRSVNGKYEIIAGERRYKASALAGLTKIPAIIRNLDDKESSKVALLENLQRKNLSPIEEARTYQKILEIDQMTQEELAKTMGKSQSAVANKLRLLSLPEEVQEALLKEQISERHARSLLNIPDANSQKEMLKKVVNTKMSVRSLEEEIKREYGKDNGSTNKEISLENNFVNNSPLMPNADLSTPEDNYGKVTIAPPLEDFPEDEKPVVEQQENKFINYGEVNGNDELLADAPTQINPSSLVEQVDINQIKENANDFETIDSTQNGGLDSLLNINNNGSGPAIGGDNFKFLTPAEGIVQEQSIPEVNKPTGDYFKPSDNDNFTELTPTDYVSNEAEEKREYTIEEATSKIRDLADELKRHGIDITIDEMDFEKSYQVIVKINK